MHDPLTSIFTPTTSETQRVLVAMSDPGAAAAICKQVETLGFAPTDSTTDASAAVKSGKSGGLDLAVIDIGLATPRGAPVIDVTSGLLPTIAVSSTGSSEDLETAADAGAIGILVQPFSTRQLAATIAMGLRARAGEAELAQRVRDLEQRLKDRRTIEEAKWLLVEQLGLTEDTAHRRLMRLARDLRRSLPDVANSLIEHNRLLHSPSVESAGSSRLQVAAGGRASVGGPGPVEAARRSA